MKTLFTIQLRQQSALHANQQRQPESNGMVIERLGCGC